MEHHMKLKNKPYTSIKSGTKTIELRLYDEKRQLVKEKDTIKFTNITTNETMLVEVEKLHKYKNFEELYKHFDKTSLGYKESDIANPIDMEQYYSKEEQSKYGVVGIQIKKLTKTNNKLQSS